jgi:catechol 2,3-dioxygenase-like lactoylglutathione lyase family enzyme
MSHVTTLREVRPFLGVGDVRATAEWYRDALGFEIGDPIAGDDGTWFWVWARRGPVGFMFNLHETHEDEPGADHVHPPPTLTGSLYITVDDVDALAEEIGTKAMLEYGPTDQPHGMREIAIVDPEGYLLVFGQPIG